MLQYLRRPGVGNVPARTVSPTPRPRWPRARASPCPLLTSERLLASMRLTARVSFSEVGELGTLIFSLVDSFRGVVVGIVDEHQETKRGEYPRAPGT